MRRCMVIQPFDGGEFDKRYDEVLVPAIRNAKFEPYRGDRDPSVDVIIDHIEKNIRDAGACLADISTSNPNVWYEVGYAFALKKEVILVSKEGVKPPVDVHHRLVIKYTTDSVGDFDRLGTAITRRLAAITKKVEVIDDVSPVKPVQGLSASETLALVLLMEDRLSPEIGLTGTSIADDMHKSGFTRVGASVAIEGLVRKEFATKNYKMDQRHGEYACYEISQNGVEWCLENQDRLNLRYDYAPIGEDDIPF